MRTALWLQYNDNIVSGYVWFASFLVFLSMLIREYSESDIARIPALYYNTVHSVNSRDYTPEEIQAWAPEIYPDSHWLRRFDNYMVYVAEECGEVVGFAEFQYPGHIDCFYVHHEWQRRGVGSLLCNRIEKEAERIELARLFVDASITARSFFSSRGFVTVRKQEKNYRDLQFRQYFMEKHINHE